jgi:hypothetical protein
MWRIVEETHKVFTISRIAAVVKMTARKEYQLMHQGAYESIITYKEQFDTVLKAYQDQENPELDEVDVAIDFFDGLDNGRYAEFKKLILNGMTAASVAQPASLNEMYLLANQWLKTTGTTQSGLASTFVTKLNMPDVNKHQGKGRRQPIHNGSDAESKAPNENTKPKPKHDLSKVKCFNCGQRGHTAPNCPKNEQKELETEINGRQFTTWGDCQFEETDSKSGMYTTYEVYESVHTTPKFR